MMTMSRWLRAPAALVLSFLVLAGARATADDDAVVARMRRDITFLASDECEGRGPGTPGIDKAAEYIAAEFAKAGCKAGGLTGSFFQPFTVAGQSKLGTGNSVRLRGPLGQEITLTQGKHYEVMGLSGTGKISAPLVFVGYGASAPKIDYDDYKGIDVAGKIVVILRHTPRWSSKEVPFDGERKEEHAGLVNKQARAEAAKAAAVILVNDSTEAPAGDKLMPFGYLTGEASKAAIPAVQVRRSVLDAIMQSAAGQTLKDIEQAIDRDLKPRSAKLAGWSASIETTVQRNSISVKNVIAVVEGNGPLANETVVVGAHYDHLGYGGRGSLAKDKAKAIHHGADDNASGTTSVMELARRFAAMPERQGRRLVFITFSAEEMGLLGSRYYCNKEPLFPLAQTVAMVNLDMVGRMTADPKTEKSKLIVEGVKTGKSFEKLIGELGVDANLQLTTKPGGMGPSDHDSFYRKEIPVFFFWTGLHSDYHRPSDTSDKINVPGMARIAGLAEKVIARLAADKDRPEYVKVASSFSPSAGKIPRIGIMPNYETEKEGVLVGGVTGGGPAEKAGIKSGDQIVEVAGSPVRNLNTYMTVMGRQQRGRAVDITVMRDGKKLNFKVVPQ
jgi:hypothetical protein